MAKSGFSVLMEALGDTLTNATKRADERAQFNLEMDKMFMPIERELEIREDNKKLSAEDKAVLNKRLEAIQKL